MRSCRVFWQFGMSYDKRDSSIREGGSKPLKVVEAKALVACSVPSGADAAILAATNEALAH